ncbi:C2H2-type domain-containing protein [Citrus sinensis]|uniref:C2H2-type domain-containing protein n=1 Tax=Citrus sinensis TaxID=2711 RepID=A0ACB8II00_CITSI|nr:C2H2-type domain-containing protein [Citrus sinensis]
MCLELQESKEKKIKELFNQLEIKGVIRPAEPYVLVIVEGDLRLYNNDKLVNHFKQIHKREQKKRLNQIESAKGKMREHLVGNYSMRMETYKMASKATLTPKVGYSLVVKLKRVWFWVRTMSDKLQAADVLLRNYMVDMMDKRRFGCLVFVSDDSDFVEVLQEATLSDADCIQKEDKDAWWELESSDAESTS